jgi:hypothetical protein
VITVACWRWGEMFGPIYVNRLRAMVERHLHIPHQFVCITRNAEGFDDRVRVLTPPTPPPSAIRCRRRMWQFAAERADDLGDRILVLDLDVVIVDDITPLVDRPEPIVGWKVGYAGVYSGSFLLFDAGALDAAWQAYHRDPVGYPMLAGEQYASDQAMLNYHLRGRAIAHWTERDGLITWFGKGYEALQHHGMGPARPNPPPGTRVVVMGSADKIIIDEGRYPFIRENWR